jgi:penicillin-binding protein-related factor A (putative recombinase)
MNTITDLRAHLFDTLKGLKDKTIDIETAKAISEVAKQITDSAKVEVDYARVTGAEISGFIKTESTAPKISGGRTVHKLRG